MENSFDASDGVRLLLVNLISPDYLVRFQAPLAVNTLAAFVSAKDDRIDIDVLDMQRYFENYLSEGLCAADAFNNALRHTEDMIRSFSRVQRCVVGLSMKFRTTRVTDELVRCFQDDDNVLFVLGNVGSTFGYRTLLLKPHFRNVIAVVGEGEDALLNILQCANDRASGFRDVSLYARIPNVAVNIGGKIVLDSFKRVDLAAYPEAMLGGEAIYDKEWDVHALETSRGCPWARCTFCSIDRQFGGDLCRSGDKSWQGFPVERVLRQVRVLVGEGVRVIDIKDSDFFGPIRTTVELERSMERIRCFAEGLIEINAGLSEKGDSPLVLNHISVRVDSIFRENDIEGNKKRLEVYSLLKRAGLKGVYLGIESGSPSQLRRYCKGTSVYENKMALKIMADLGLEVEPGFIFFDFLANVEELKENIRFIEDTELYLCDSRILGSLRVQQGSSYVMIAQNSCLLGVYDEESLGFDCKYVDKDVEAIERIYSAWESSTKNLMKLLTVEERRAHNLLNFEFLKEVVFAYGDASASDMVRMISRFIAKRDSVLADNLAADRRHIFDIEESRRHISQSIMDARDIDRIACLVAEEARE